jgi:hypothetical protein
MDEWLDGANGPKSHFHNFKYDFDHRNCFVFKYNEHRFYGFLCHPKDTELRFHLCSVCIYTTKHEHQSDERELDRVEAWCGSLGAPQAIARVYPPKLKGKRDGSSWKN